MPAAARSNATHQYVDSHDVSLKEHLEDRINNLEKSLLERFQAQEKSTENALAANEKRLDSMNEFRDALRDQNNTFVTKIESDIQFCALERRLNNIDEIIKGIQISDAVLAGKASQTAVIIAYVIGFIGLALSIIDFASGK